MNRATFLFGLLVVGGVLAFVWSRVPPGDPLAAKTVRDYGAFGNGVADDSDAIQKTVDASLGSVRIPRGVYRLTKSIVIDLDKIGVTAVIGDGGATLQMDGAGPALRFVGTHEGTAQPSSVKPPVWDRQMTPRVSGLDILGNHAEADGIEAVGTMQLTVESTAIRKCRHGIHLVKRNRNVLVSACHIYSGTGCGIFLDDVNLHQINIVGSHISYCDGGGVVVKAGEVRNIQIGTCDIEANMAKDGPPKDGIPTANVLIDCVGGSTAEVAITGSTLQHSNVPGAANIRILGRGAGIKKGTNAQWGHVTIGHNVFSDVAVNVDLKDCRGVTITGNTFWMGYEHNLRAEDCQQMTLGNNLFERNPAYDYGTSTKTKNAILFKNCRDCTLTGNHAEGIRGVDNAVHLDGCERFNLSGNTILDCDGVGLLLSNCRRCRVSDSLIRHDGAGAADAWSLKTIGGSGNVLKNNTLGNRSDVAKDDDETK